MAETNKICIERPFYFFCQRYSCQIQALCLHQRIKTGKLRTSQVSIVNTNVNCDTIYETHTKYNL